ncbi:hypothetical protein QBC33DRAFT_544239 [Phialemonium atrogriseum]|uniref:Uncharacterized protein n=1 Tax=Phialemonium atrogriseum TaxID=1093897 RepID=A0AAJ0BVU8_9PEZI|nr:uncharacterized protein QBC33DRAFT_544239 [Phialemonium atrogriseum]KAK1765410.1 hypothetical protein QBC33DRAFT_544239 [Phialemonium atrogriseum]
MSKENQTFVYIDGKRYNCSQDEAVDLDVAGIGVMVSFWASAAITFICIIVGYLRGTLPGVPQNEADSLIKGLIRQPWTCRETLFSSRPISKAHDKIPRAESGSRIEEAFESFLLSFSDQQLVTGLAMLVSMFSKGDITIYSFQLATAVAWFSSTIHLATLVVLRRFLRRNKWSRILRVSIMLVVVVLLLAANSISVTTDLSHSRNRPSDAIFCAYRKTKYKGVDLFSIIWLVYAFTTRVIQVSVPEPSDTSRQRIFDRFRNRLGNMPTIRDRVSSRIAALRQQEHPSVSTKFHLAFSAIYFAHIELSSSFAWQVIWLTFSFGYGVRISTDSWSFCYSMAEYWQDPSSDPARCLTPALQMGFGQIVPLVLLALPVLSFVGAFFGETTTTPETANATTNATSPIVEGGNPDPGNHTEAESSNFVDPETSAFNTIAQQAPTNSGERFGIAEPTESLDDRGNLPNPDPYELLMVRGFVIFLCSIYFAFVVLLVVSGLNLATLSIFAMDILYLLDEARAFAVALHIVPFVLMRQARGRQREESV